MVRNRGIARSSVYNGYSTRRTNATTLAFERCDDARVQAQAVRLAAEALETAGAVRPLQQTHSCSTTHELRTLHKFGIDPRQASSAAAAAAMESDGDQTVHTVPPITVHTPDEPELSVALIGCGWYALRPTACVKPEKTTIAAVCARTEASRRKRSPSSATPRFRMSPSPLMPPRAHWRYPHQRAGRVSRRSARQGLDSEKPAAWSPGAEDLREAWDDRPDKDQRWRVLGTGRSNLVF